LTPAPATLESPGRDGVYGRLTEGLVDPVLFLLSASRPMCSSSYPRNANQPRAPIRCFLSSSSSSSSCGCCYCCSQSSSTSLTRVREGQFSVREERSRFSSKCLLLTAQAHDLAYRTGMSFEQLPNTFTSCLMPSRVRTSSMLLARDIWALGSCVWNSARAVCDY
jgi:hypothetical protein